MKELFEIQNKKKVLTENEQREIKDLEEIRKRPQRPASIFNADLEYEDPIYPIQLAIWFGSYKNPKWNNSLENNLIDTFSNGLENARHFIYNLALKLVKTKGPEMLIDELVFGLDDDLDLLYKQFYEIMQIHYKMLDPRNPVYENETVSSGSLLVSNENFDLVDNGVKNEIIPIKNSEQILIPGSSDLLTKPMVGAVIEPIIKIVKPIPQKTKFNFRMNFEDHC
jgi:hypothetical protein